MGVDLAEIPEWLREKIERSGGVATPAALAQRALKRAVSRVASALEGERNATLNTVAFGLGGLIAAGELTLAQVERDLTGAAISAGLPHKEVEATLQSGLTAGRKKLAARKEPPPLDPRCTEAANAARLARTLGERMRYVSDWGWMVWDGMRWERDKTRKVMVWAEAALKKVIPLEAATLGEEGAEALMEFGYKSFSRNRLKAAVELAEGRLAMRAEDFNQHPWLLNVQNGILDLRTGDLMPHNSGYRITKLAGAAYHPEAECPRWEAFLETVLNGDQALIGYLQQAVGYSLTGDTREQCLFFPYGAGANGKSTFLRAILEIVGDYGVQAPPALLVEGESKPYAVAALEGARFVSVSEIASNKRLALHLVKQLTGGDKISARHLYQDYFEFVGTGKLWFPVNQKPGIKENSESIWRRIRLLPFTVTIPEAERDRDLLEKLRAELDGILAWAVRGCLDWQSDGRLMAPKAVEQATGEYRAEMDVLAGFIQACCVEGVGVEAGATDMYKAYKAWCETGGDRVWSQRFFSQRLGERGFKKKRVTSGMFWIGLSLRDSIKE